VNQAGSCSTCNKVLESSEFPVSWGLKTQLAYCVFVGGKVQESTQALTENCKMNAPVQGVNPWVPEQMKKDWKRPLSVILHVCLSLNFGVLERAVQKRNSKASDQTTYSDIPELHNVLTMVKLLMWTLFENEDIEEKALKCFVEVELQPEDQWETK
jgi:hypothetical protein